MCDLLDQKVGIENAPCGVDSRDHADGDESHYAKNLGGCSECIGRNVLRGRVATVAR
jgi:hypothetical protein